MLSFLIFVGVVIYILISAGTIVMLSYCTEEDLPFLSEQNASLLLKNTIPLGIMWPILLVILILCSFVLVINFIKNISFGN